MNLSNFFVVIKYLIEYWKDISYQYFCLSKEMYVLYSLVFYIGRLFYYK